MKKVIKNNKVAVICGFAGNIEEDLDTVIFNTLLIKRILKTENNQYILNYKDCKKLLGIIPYVEDLILSIEWVPIEERFDFHCNEYGDYSLVKASDLNFKA